MSITIKELARKLELDHSTVAYALSGKGTVKESTRQRVREAAEELGYVPNVLARRMRAKRTGVIGLVVPDVGLRFNDLVQSLFRLAGCKGHHVEIVLTDGSPRREDESIRSLLESRVDGIILKSAFRKWDDVPARHALRQAAAQNVPIVTYGPPIDGSNFPGFRMTPRRRARVLTAHLLQKGHRQMAWLIPMDKPMPRGESERLAGMEEAFRAAGLEFVPPVTIGVRGEEAVIREPAQSRAADFGGALKENGDVFGAPAVETVAAEGAGACPATTAGISVGVAEYSATDGIATDGIATDVIATLQAPAGSRIADSHRADSHRADSHRADSHRVEATVATAIAAAAADAAENDAAELMRTRSPRSAIRRGRLLMRRALALSPRPTAVLCMNDSSAIGAIVEAEAQGLCVPEDVAIAAARNTVAAELSPISLTTADVPPALAAENLLDLLLARIEGRPTAMSAEADPILTLGASTGDAVEAE